MKYMIAFILGIFIQMVPSEASPWDTRKEHKEKERREHDKDHKHKYSDHEEQKMIL